MTDNLPEIVEQGPATMFALIERMASNPQVDIGKLQALLDMQERLENRQREAAFNAAFARLQQRLPRITKKGEIKYDANPDAKTAAGRKGSSTAYARWEDIMEAILPHLHEEGFALTYDAPPGPDGRITCVATLIHRDGHSRSSSFGPMPLDTSGGKNNLQAAGSTDSYGKRFATRDLLNLVYEGLDDDGVRGGMVFMTAADIAEIETLIAETKSNRLRFLEYMGVAELENIQARDKQRAIAALMQKKRPPQGAGPLPSANTGAKDGPANTTARGSDPGPPSQAGMSVPAADRGARGGSGKAPAAAAADTNAKWAEADDPAWKPSEGAQESVDEAGDASEANAQGNAPSPARPSGPVRQEIRANQGAPGERGGSPSTDLVTHLDRRLTEAAQNGRHALDTAWIKLSPQEQDLARGRRQHYYDIAGDKK
jgi:hypothetical protein